MAKAGDWFRRLTSTLVDVLSETPYRTMWVGIVVAAVMFVLCGVVLYQGHEDALTLTRENARNVALVAERDIARNFELYALSLQSVVDNYLRPDVQALPIGLRRELLFDRAATAQYLGSLLVLDRSGNIVMDAGSDIPRRGNFADREYFKIQRDHPHVGLYISEPFKSRLRNGSPSIALSRRLSNPDGSFAGIVFIAVTLEYFHKLFSGLEFGPHGSMVLVSTGGTLIMRQSYDPRQIDRDLMGSHFEQLNARNEGTFTGIGALDGGERFYTFKHIPGLPLIVMVASAKRDIYATWTRRALIIGSMMGVFGVAFVALAAVLGGQLRRRVRAEAELRALARTDGLTGLNNRRTLGEILDQEWRRARRSRTVFAVLFVDIDWFKHYNDTYGHQAGDDALAAVAKCIRENLQRPADTAARYGGEEFIVVLPETTGTGAEVLAEKIRHAVAALAVEHGSSAAGRVTVSIGAASWDPQDDGEVASVDTLIRAADAALYDAKAAGRNRVAYRRPVPLAEPELAAD